MLDRTSSQCTNCRNILHCAQSPSFLQLLHASGRLIAGVCAAVGRTVPHAFALHADLDVLRPEAFMLQTPALDWTFGGTFPEVMLEDTGDEQE